MTKEDIEFLRDLQHELNTQPNDGNADPVFWGIVQDEKVYTQNGDELEIIVDSEASYSLEDFIEFVEEDKDEWSDEIKERWEDVDKEDAEEVCEFAEETWNGMTAYPAIYEIRETLAQNKFFLTKRTAKEYVERYGYNHNNPRTYAQTAVRNPEFERLLRILKTMNIDNLVADE